MNFHRDEEIGGSGQVRPRADSPVPLLLVARDAAGLCGASERTWRTWDAGGLIPRAVTIGRAKFWRQAELEKWVAHGCPARQDWEVLTAGEPR